MYTHSCLFKGVQKSVCAQEKLICMGDDTAQNQRVWSFAKCEKMRELRAGIERRRHQGKFLVCFWAARAFMGVYSLMPIRAYIFARRAICWRQRQSQGCNLREWVLRAGNPPAGRAVRCSREQALKSRRRSRFQQLARHPTLPPACSLACRSRCAGRQLVGRGCRAGCGRSQRQARSQQQALLPGAARRSRPRSAARFAILSV